MKRRIIIDMDNTLIQSAKACIELYQKDKGIKLDWNIKDLQWNFKPYVPDEDFDTVINYFNDQRMYDIAEPMKDSIEVLKELHKDYEIVVVTKSHRYALPYKANWLYNTYGDSIDRVVYLTQKDFDKSFIAGSCIIDDKVEAMCGGDRECRILFGDYYYNKYNNLTKKEKIMFDGESRKGNCILKMNSWKEISEYFKLINK